MRLTLRTLLAYLDDTLEPAQTKLIGQKVAESPAAQELITRIREVVRRRRLTTPPATGPGAKMDANTVAEYLDNELPAEQLAEVEEVCLNSDLHLAEIAACHQILTVLLSEPALVPPTARRRMYGLSQGREAIPSRKAALVPADTGQDAAGDAGDDADEALLLGLPLLLRRGPWWRRVAPLAGVALLVAALIGAIWWSSRGLGQTNADAKVAKGSDDTKAVTSKQSDARPTTDHGPDQKKPEDGKVEPPADKKSDGVKENIAARPRPDEHPAGDQKTDDKKLAGNEPDKSADASAPALPKQERREVGRYVSASKQAPSILLQRRDAKEAWQRVRDSPVYTTDHLVSLPGYRSELQLRSGVGLSLWGSLQDGRLNLVWESAVVLNHNADPAVDLDLTLLRGRIALSNRKSQGPAAPSPGEAKRRREEATVRVRFRTEAWDITLDRDAEVALELSGSYPRGVRFNDPRNDGPQTFLALFAAKGRANLKVGYFTYLLQEPPGPSWFLWDDTGKADAGPQHLDKLPWFLSLKVPDDVAKGLATFSNHLAGKDGIDVAVNGAVTDESDPSSRRLGVMTLGAIDDLPNLLDALRDENHPDVRFTAIDTLRHWLSLGGDYDKKLFEQMKKKFRQRQAEIVMELLYLYSLEQQENPSTWESLIEFLRNDNLAIRELANYHLSNMPRSQAIAMSIKYNPAGGIEEQERGYRAWKERIPDGKVPPLPRPAAAAPGATRP